MSMADVDKETSQKDASLWELFFEFFKLGMFTIGGGITMIPLLQGIVAEKKHWMTEDEAIDCIAVSQSLPGVVAINMATYVGSKKRGLAGAFAATVGVALPSLISIILVIEVLKGIGGNRYIVGALKGMKAAAAGMIAYAAYTIGSKVLKDTFSWTLGIAAFCLITLFDINVIFVIIGAVMLGLAYTAYRKKGQGDPA